MSPASRSCRRCGVAVPYSGVGQPKTVCDACWQLCPTCDKPNGVDLAKRPGGVSRVCKKCRNAQLRDRWARLSKGVGPGRGRPRPFGPHEFILHRVCVDCGERKPWAEFPPRAYHPDGSARLVGSRCHRCDVRRTLERRAKNPEEQAKHRLAQARWGRRRSAELRAERSGLSDRIPSGPFGLWLAKVLDEHGELAIVASLCGVNERSIRRVLTQANVTRHFADRCFTRTGYHLNDFYPEDEELAA